MVLAVSSFHMLLLDELLTAFGIKKAFRLIPIHILAINLEEQRSRALTFFHAFKGFDCCSSCSSVGETAWDTWTVVPDVTEACVDISTQLQKYQKRTFNCCNDILYYFMIGLAAAKLSMNNGGNGIPREDNLTESHPQKQL